MKKNIPNIVIGLLLFSAGCDFFGLKDESEDNSNNVALLLAAPSQIEIAGTWEGKIEDAQTRIVINDRRWTFQIDDYNTYGDVQRFNNDDKICILLWGIGDIDEGDYYI